MYNQIIQLYKQTFFFIFFSTVVYHGILKYIFLLYRKILLVIHSIYNSLCLLIPDSQSSSSPSLLLGSHKSVLCVCQSPDIIWHANFFSIKNDIGNGHIFRYDIFILLFLSSRINVQKYDYLLFLSFYNSVYYASYFAKAK